MKLKKPHGDFTSLETLLLEAVASRVLVESVRMKLYDQLEVPRTPAEIADRFGVSEKGMQAFLDVLEVRGLLMKSQEAYSNSSLASEFFVSGSPFYQGDFLELRQGFMELVSNEMQTLLRKPGSVQQQIHQAVPPDDYLHGVAQHAVRGSLQDLVEVVASQDGFAAMRSMCDLGGNHGRYSMALLDKNPELKAEILDLPKMTPFVQKAVSEAGYESRITVKNFDLRTEPLMPQTYDLVLVSHVLQIFADNLETILAKIGAAVKPGGLFVSQNMNPAMRSDQRLKTCTNLVSCLLAHANHYLPQDAIANALEKAGFEAIRFQSGGENESNMIVVAKKI